MTILQEIDHKLSQLPRYLYYVADQRVNAYDVNFTFDEWYDLRTEYNRREVIANLSKRASGRTTARLKNLIEYVASIRGTKKEQWPVYLVVKNLTHRRQIFYDLQDLFPTSWFDNLKKDILYLKGSKTPIVFVTLIDVYCQQAFRGRDIGKIFYDHWTVENIDGHKEAEYIGFLFHEIDRIKHRNNDYL